LLCFGRACAKVDDPPEIGRFDHELSAP
jgi:hypothetical protein